MYGKEIKKDIAHLLFGNGKDVRISNSTNSSAIVRIAAEEPVGLQDHRLFAVFAESVASVIGTLFVNKASGEGTYQFLTRSVGYDNVFASMVGLERKMHL